MVKDCIIKTQLIGETCSKKLAIRITSGRTRLGRLDFDRSLSDLDNHISAAKSVIDKCATSDYRVICVALDTYLHIPVDQIKPME